MHSRRRTALLGALALSSFSLWVACSSSGSGTLVNQPHVTPPTVGFGDTDGGLGDGGTGGDGAVISTCGDGIKNPATETCDDGNRSSGDGCSANCRIESGWICPIDGVRCVAKECGDGVVAGDEDCDDGNRTDTDGCNNNCRISDGYKCPALGGACSPTTCGDNMREGTEQCDDGNLDPFDGCDPNCKVEPVCANGTCTSVCGDGRKFPGEACDDGNKRNGDGCSSTCQLEPGYMCTNAPQAPTLYKDLFIAYRDFAASGQPSGHPDFENPVFTTSPYLDVIQTGLVQNTLDAQGKPQFLSRRGNGQEDIIQDATSFSQWYRENAFSKKTVSTIRLTQQSPPLGVTYQFNNTAFFPLDTAANTWPDRAYGHNFHFTSEIHIPFTYKGTEVLTFHGDDDVWVFLNGRLALDLGGIKNARDVTITLDATAAASFGLTVGGFYEFAIFQAERHVTGSNYQLTLSDFDKILTSCVSRCGDGVKTPDEACDDGTAGNDGAYGHCNSDCRTRAPHCGDGIVQSDKEECDSTPGCSPDCRLAINAPK